MSLRDSARSLVRALLPEETRRWITLQQRKHKLQWPRAGSVRFGDLERLTPISKVFGFDRGQAIDRYYIEAFLAANAAHIRGRALELGDATYIRRFGGGKVTQTDVLHVVAGNPEATIIADLTDADHIPSDSFDCIIFTQSLQMIYDMRAALRTLHRILKPGGSVLITSAGIAKIGRRLGRDDWGEYWHLTSQSMQRLLDEHFPGGTVEVRTYGNVFAAICFLQGLAAEELLPEHLDTVDPDFEVLVAARARKAGGTP
ncbi:MAG: methyltransferase domain-containing protein [Alphaproteobacteria bacterium]|nr:methyltransferase domain-containing protein [Alphaproteobacteria bacterium]